MGFIEWWKRRTLSLKAAIIYLTVIFIMGVVMVLGGGEMAGLGGLIVVMYLLSGVLASIIVIGIQIMEQFG